MDTDKVYCGFTSNEFKRQTIPRHKIHLTILFKRTYNLLYLVGQNKLPTLADARLALTFVHGCAVTGPVALKLILSQVQGVQEKRCVHSF